RCHTDRHTGRCGTRLRGRETVADRGGRGQGGNRKAGDSRDTYGGGVILDRYTYILKYDHSKPEKCPVFLVHRKISDNSGILLTIKVKHFIIIKKGTLSQKRSFDMSKVMIFGLGEVGTHILQFIVRDRKCQALVICDFNEAVSEKRNNNALIGASIHRLYPKVSFEQADLTDVDRTAETIAEYEPDVIINCAVLQTWHVIRQLPEEEYER